MPASAYAQGSITGVTVDPAQAVKGQEVAVQIAATDNTVCADLQIMFGDGASTVLKNQSLVPGFQIKHQYTKAGIFTVMVRGINGCSGAATAVVKVKSSILGANPSVFAKQKSSLAELCQKVDCEGVTSKTKPKIKLNICVQPVIKGLFLPKIQPGSIIAVKGCGFGNQPGEISLALTHPPFHSPSLEILEWKDGFIGARLPDHKLDSGVIDQPARLIVKTKSNKQSEGWKVFFVANKTVLLLPPGAVKYDCSDQADINRCHTKPVETIPAEIGLASYFVQHHTTDIFDDSDKGGDEIHTILRNGWRFESLTFDYVFLDDEKESTVTYPTVSHGLIPSGQLKPGVTFDAYFRLKIKWRSDDVVAYWGNVYVIGPVGVNYK